LKNKDFICSWTIPEYICDEILDYYNNNKNLHHKGVVFSNKTQETRDDYKVSTDLSIQPNNQDRPFGEYRSELQNCLNLYVETYPHVNKIHRFNVTEVYNIQHYKKGEGFKAEHCERDGAFNSTLKRCLVFMTYLNDVDDGGTKFIYQDRIIKAQKGKTIIWPADWTHTHVGQISETKEKTIVTGWFSYLW
jgi:hypothetical protein